MFIFATRHIQCLIVYIEGVFFVYIQTHGILIFSLRNDLNLQKHRGQVWKIPSMIRIADV